MANAQAWELFEQANRLWFFEGRTEDAVALYRRAIKIAPDDPAILFQWARVLWSLEKTSEAQTALQKVQTHSTELSRNGIELLKIFEKKLQSGAASTQRLSVRIDSLDVANLQDKSLSSSEWSAIANLAQERGMYGVALYAFEKGKGSVVSFDEEREQNDLAKAARSSLAALRSIREDM